MNKVPAHRLFNLRNPVQCLAVGFGSGLVPKAPGTFGTLAAIPLYLFLVQFSTLTYLICTLLVCIIGIFICGKAAEEVGVHDHPAIVWDEIAGYLITMAFVPVHWINILIGFLFFRFFDIIKPWPISIADKKVGNGLGIMLDDILAGAFALVFTHLLILYI